jgi:tetratricopeptide (TPR) repeat protein/predicted Ser/Thr protein kinase
MVSAAAASDSAVPHVPEDPCPQEEDIAAFVAGGMAAPHGAMVEAHVARCAACRRLISALARAAMESQSASDSVSPTLPGEPAGDPELQLGARFGRYVVLEGLGAGGMGVVYAAYDPELNRRVALKVLRIDSERAGRLPRRDLLLAEAQAMAQLAHPNVVTVFDVGSFEDRVFIAMELVEGQTLSSWLRGERRTPNEILAALLAAGNGLAAAHAAGLIHRDFKPDNVLVGHDGRVRVTDFGLARPVPEASPEAAACNPAVPGNEPSAPRTGLAGTLAYMAPEQFLKRVPDARSDQFSFAVALYEALYGQRPFASPPRSAEPEVATPAADLPRRAGVPAALRHVLLRALSPDPDQRYPSMNELLAALAPRPRRARRIAIGASLMIAAVVACGGAFAIHLRRAAEQRIEVVSRLRALAPELRTRLQGAQMAPLHDIRPARNRVRSAMRGLERQLQAPTDQDSMAVIELVLGEGHRALGDNARALQFLEAAWNGGERGSQIDVALGETLGAVYWNRLEEIDNTLPSGERDVEVRKIEQRYRDPAMDHLRSALAEQASSPAYLEALIAFHEHRFADASQAAHAVFAESETFYQAGMLEASAHHEAGRALLRTANETEARQEFSAARRIFERVLQTARSDDDAWLTYGQMVFSQAVELGGNKGLPADLQEQTIDALRMVRQINPDRWEADLDEGQIYDFEANLAIVRYQDPRPMVDKMLAMAEQARAHGAAASQVDAAVCRARWEQAVYEQTHGVDPHPAFAQAIIACERTAAAEPTADNYASLGVLYASVAVYDADRGRDPAHSVELAERNFRAALAITDDAVKRYDLGRLWSTVAHYQNDHGRDPRHVVDLALAEFETSVRMDATRSDALAAMGDVLIARARFEQAGHGDARPTIARARAALERALAVNADLVPPVKYRIELAELEAMALLEHHVDPRPSVQAMRADAQVLLRGHHSEGFAHRMSCQAEILTARWLLARGGAVDSILIRAEDEAARAREADPTDVLAWTASAEVEQLRSEQARSRHAAPDDATARGLAYIAHAMQIDPLLVRAVRIRDELVRPATAAVAAP